MSRGKREARSRRSNEHTREREMLGHLCFVVCASKVDYYGHYDDDGFLGFGRDRPSVGYGFA